MKRCPKCDRFLPRSHFSKSRNRKDGLDWRCKACKSTQERAYRQANPEKERERHSAYQEANREKERERRRAYRQANPEKERERNRAYRQANIEKVRDREKAYREANREKRNQYSSEWRKQNKSKKAENAHRRRSRQKQNGVFTISPKDMARIYASPCAGCGTHDGISVDHVVPIAKGGRHSIGNLQPLCVKCNQEKGTRLVIEWRAA